MRLLYGKLGQASAAIFRILDYAKQHGLTLFGYAYETGVNEMTINSIDEYITRIVIPVKN